MSLSIDLARTFAAAGSDPFEVRADLTVPDGETLVVLGPSGSGKSLLLECVAGFREHRGSVELDGEDLTDHPPERRGFGVVFQEYALFPHRTVRENVAFGLRYRGGRDPDRLLSELQIADLADRSPATLSGGEKQRVALARALAIDPRLLLLDEPLSALDVPTRRSLRRDLAAVLDDLTAVYVTHDRTTARVLADRVAVLAEGTVRQVGTPEDVFERPESAFVARFTGANCLPASLLGGRSDHSVAIRPEHVRLTAEGDLQGVVERVVREEATVRVELGVGDVTVDAFVEDPPGEGETVGVELPEEHLVSLAD